MTTPVDDWDLRLTPLSDPTNVMFLLVPEDDVTKLPRQSEQLTAAADMQTGAMIAFVPSTDDCDELEIEDGEPADQLHTTALYLGKAEDIPEETQAAIVALMKDIASRQDVIVANVFAFSVFNPDTPDACLVALSGGVDIDDAHETIVAEMGEAEFSYPEQHDPWVSHITLVYAQDPRTHMTDDVLSRTGPIVYDRIRVAFAGVVTDIPLGDTLSAAMTEFHLAGKHNQATHGRGGGGQLERLDGRKLKKAKAEHADGVKRSKTGGAAMAATPGQIDESTHYAGAPGDPPHPPGFRDINEGLAAAHGNVDDVTLSPQSGGAYANNDELRGAIRSMDATMGGSNLTDDIVVSRIVRNPEAAFGGSIKKGVDNSGVTWQSHRYTSTSTSEGLAVVQQRARLGLSPEDVHYGGAQGMHMKIRAPKGTHAARGSAGEGEIVFDRGSKFRIINDHGISSEGLDAGLWVVDVEVLP